MLKDIFRRLYYPDSTYEFSVLPAEILGHVYERFLGSVIRLTEGGRAKVEQKPEVRKAGGVYYTPSHIVEYIVRPMRWAAGHPWRKMGLKNRADPDLDEVSRSLKPDQKTASLPSI